MDTTNCPRCSEVLRSYSTSFFDTEVICSTCKREERHFPGYAAAVEAENAATHKGNYNFPGIGLSRADRDAMYAAIAARKVVV